MCCESNIQYFPNVGSNTIVDSNGNLDGTGSIYDLIIGGSGDGTIVQNVIIKATQLSNPGMIRFFIYNPAFGGTYYLYTEVPIPATNTSNLMETLTLNLSFKICIPASFKLGVSSQNGENFSVTAQAINWINCPCN